MCVTPAVLSVLSLVPHASLCSYLGCPCQSHGGDYGMRPWTKLVGSLVASSSTPVASLVDTTPERVP